MYIPVLPSEKEASIAAADTPSWRVPMNLQRSSRLQAKVGYSVEYLLGKFQFEPQSPFESNCRFVHIFMKSMYAMFQPTKPPFVKSLSVRKC